MVRNCPGSISATSCPILRRQFSVLRRLTTTPLTWGAQASVAIRMRVMEMRWQRQAGPVRTRPACPAATSGADDAAVGTELEQQAPDLDTLLVAVGGGGLLGGIAAWYAGGDMIRLVAVTGYGQPYDRVRAREAGFDLHLTKPVSPREIGAALRSS